MVAFFKNPRKRLLRRMPKGSVCAEIGVWKGDFSRKILRYTQPKRLHLIDPWKFQPEFPNRWFGGKRAKGQADMDQIYESVRKRFADAPSVSILRDFSDQALARFEDESLDWVYLDGNHAYDHVRKDLSLALAKVRPGGFITGDDYTWGRKCGFPVEKAVRDFVKEHALEAQLEIIDTQFLIRKPQNSDGTTRDPPGPS